MSDEIYVEYAACKKSIVYRGNTYHEYELFVKGDAWQNEAFAEKVNAAFHSSPLEDARVMLDPQHSLYKAEGGGYDGRDPIRIIALATSPTGLSQNARDVFENAVRPLLNKHGLARETTELRYVYR